MKSIFALLLAAQAIIINGDIDRSNAAEICGELGVMEVPEGADASQYRLCRSHPNFHNPAILQSALSSLDSRSSSSAKTERAIFARHCIWEEYYACAGGACWNKCGPDLGTWCYIATNNGVGDWYTCRYTEDCSYQPPGSGCGTPCDCDIKWVGTKTLSLSSTTTTTTTTTASRKATTTERWTTTRKS